MRIAIDAVGIRGHGAAAVLCELLHWLPIMRPDWEWHIFLFDRRLREFDDPIVSKKVTFEHIGIGNGGLGRLAWIERYLPVRIASQEIDLLFSFANVAPSHSRIPQVVFCHQRNALSTEAISAHALLRRARMRLLRNCILRGARASDAIIVQTEAMRKCIIKLDPSLDGRVYVIPSGYRIPSENPDVRSEKRLLIDAAGKPTLIYVAHPSCQKNHIALVRAIPRITEVFPSTSLLLTIERHCSSFPPSYRNFVSLIESLRKEVDYLGVSQRLIWLGQLNLDEVYYALRSSDLTVFPSLAESFGLGLVESMAAGCPIVAADRSYAHDVCGEAAVYFDPNDPANIAKIVTTVCRERETMERLRSMGTRRKERFSYEKIADNIARIFESVITRSL